ncbi:winged helix family two component transcriptional regulator [Orenia metallireducens]|uniref:response regulator transcription factor n=1 Tax=Orenia metallireducens TaxID=1413210 RepID=UPI000D0731F8|nr:response regulator transcription factor [Orenia metallireducens]PRX31046.1 winged helix family two component transcriptional regulator [Orenia metallireducens]
MRLLIVEDEYHLAEVLQKGLKEDGYAVDTVNNGEEALDLATVIEYDLIILDLMLPVKSGLEVLRELRDQGNKVPVLILTAKESIEDKVRGLDLGADDYLTKPFAFAELRARIRALFRRKLDESNNVLKIDNLVLDTITHKVTRAGKEIELTVKEYSVLEYLMRNRGQVLNRTQIEEHVWDYRYGSNSNIVDVYIRYLRKKIDKDFDRKLIETVRGRGYRLKGIKQ